MQESQTSEKEPRAAGGVRQADIEPYTALRWVGLLFKGAAIFLLVAIVGEFIAALRVEGAAALPIVMGEVVRTLALGVILWGGGDLVRLLMHLGHDIRAQRVLLVRIASRIPATEGGVEGQEPDAEEAGRALRDEGERRPEPRQDRVAGPRTEPGRRATA